MMKLDCGCEMEVPHIHDHKGDRYVECACGRAWVVNRREVMHVTYTVTETTRRVA